MGRRDRPVVRPLHLCLVRLPRVAVPLRALPRLRLPPPHQTLGDPLAGEAGGQEVGRLGRVPRVQEEDARPVPLPQLRWPRGAAIRSVLHDIKISYGLIRSTFILQLTMLMPL